jgi:DNA-binding transcriptional LysR family regulator
MSAAMTTERPELEVRLEEDVTPDLLRRVAGGELAAAVVQETPGAARQRGVRIDALRDEPMLAALPATHPHAGREALPMEAFAAECVLLPREPAGRAFNDWLRAMFRAAGYGLERTLETLSAPWDHRLLPVAEGEAVCVIVREWVGDSIPGVVTMPLDPPLSFPVDLASRWPPAAGVDGVVSTALQLRDEEAWLTLRPARTELPDD